MLRGDEPPSQRSLSELADAASIFSRPRHPYTAALMKAVPLPDPGLPSGTWPLQGEVPSPANPPSGCYFIPRCPFAVEVCRTEPPALRLLAPGHLARCHRAEELTLDGIGAGDGPARAG